MSGGTGGAGGGIGGAGAGIGGAGDGTPGAVRPPPYPGPEATDVPAGFPADIPADLPDRLAQRLGSAAGLVRFLDTTSDGGVFIWDLRRRDEVWSSEHFRDLLGYDATIESVWLLWDRIDPVHADVARRAFEAHLRDPGQPYEVQVRYRHRDGQWVWFRSRGLVLRDGDVPDLFVCFNTVVTDLVEATERSETSLRALSEFTRSVQLLDQLTSGLQSVPTADGVVDSMLRSLTDRAGGVGGVAEFCMLTEPAEDGSVELIAAVDVGGAPLDWLRDSLRAVSEDHDSVPLLRATMDAGHPVLIPEVTVGDFFASVGLTTPADVDEAQALSFLLVPWARGSERRGAVVVARRIGEFEPFDERDRPLVQQIVDRHADAYHARLAQLELANTQRLRQLASGAPFGLLQFDTDGRCSYVNETWTTLTGLGREESLGDGWASTMGETTRSRLVDGWSAVRPGEPPVTEGVWVPTRSGSRRWLSLTASAVPAEDGDTAGIIVMAGDDTARRAAEARLERLAHQDPLTGLANRRRLFEALDQSLRTLGDGSCLAVVFVDLDYFKEVNDALGHDAGDRLLVELARRLRLVARPGELVARVGGDEFVLVLAVDGHEDASARVESLMRALDDRVESGGLRLAVNVSVGLATLGPEDAGITADEAVQRADSAMYLAKTSGRNRWAAYDDDLRGRDRLRSEVWQLLDNSLREGRVAVVFQPIVDLESGRIVGAEALARIRDPLPTLLSPEVFLDVAEETGLIVPLGEAVVAEACARLGEWTRIDPDFVVTVNLSGRQLAHPGAGRMILRALDAVGVAPDRLCVEITESVLIEVVGDLADSVQDLRRAGVRLALDDFGTGYSSLGRIRDFPIDVVKIDRSFVSRAADDPIDAAIVASVVQLAASLDLLVVAEGVEDERQLEAVRQLGCEQGQGYLFGAPVDAGALRVLVGTAFVADRRPAAD